MDTGAYGGSPAPPWLSAWAKSFYDPERRLTHWLPLSQHLDDSAAVARRLVDQWLPRQVVARIGRDLPGGSGDVEPLAAWLAGVHDVGKLSPAFAVQEKRLADHMRRHGLVASPEFVRDPMRSRISHSLVGHAAVRDWLATEMGFSRRGVALQLASIVGSHHGVSPERGQLADVADFPHLAGGGPWATARASALEHATARIGGSDVLTRFRDARLSSPTSVLLSAVVIVADWIASNTDLFGLEPISTLDLPPWESDPDTTTRRVEQAWQRLNLPRRWQPVPLSNDLDAEFHHRFPRISTARPVQVAAVRAAQALSEPGIVVVEAPMGVGKTEAALVAAEALAGMSGAGGCFVALPTQATTDAMFARASEWLRALPRNDEEPLTVNLAHGKASLNDAFDGLVRAGTFARVGDDGADSITAHQWLRGSKKGPLASFVVGTVDQVLVAALKSRHLMLRHLALAGKVVIIDEVHAYDVYMSQYLQRVLHWLGAYGVPVVLLSATLPAARRNELLIAYATGRGEEVSLHSDADPGYPVIVSSGEAAAHVVADTGVSTIVRLDQLDDDLDSLVAYLRAKLADGGCAAVIRNTVGRVQETADRLASEFGPDTVTVNHSRFLSCDRARIDTDLVRRFGAPGPGNDRRGPHIVVASQVLEQSLDVDFDILVTDLAPIDLVLQRLGRMHRHQRDRPPAVTEAQCAVVGVEDWSGNPVRAVPGSRRVYGEYALLRSAALLADRKTICLPGDISPLVQAAYGRDPLGPPSWQQTMCAATEAADADSRRRRDKAAHFLLDDADRGGSLVGWLQAGVGDADGQRGAAQVRDGAESLEVLVVQSDQDGGLLTPDWIPRGAGQQIPLDQPIATSLAKVIAACSLRMPLALSHERVIDAVITVLEKNHFSSFDQTQLLAGQLVLVLDGDRQATVRAGEDTFLLTYDIHRGLIHERR